MNILILGGTGFLGSNCARVLSSKHKVYVTGLEDANNTFYETIVLNFNETDRLFTIIKEKKINLIIHLVSNLLPNSTQAEYIEHSKNVFIPTVKLLDFCTCNKIKIVFFSSGGTIYGTGEKSFSESSNCAPISYYGLSKLEIENLISFYHRNSGLEYMIIRPSNPYGPGQSLYGKQGLISVIIGNILKNKPIEIWGDGSATKDYIYIDDFVYLVTALIETPSAWNTTYNVGSGKGYSINRIIDAFRKNDILLPEISYVKHKTTDVSHVILDCKKLNSIIKYNCIDIEQGIKKYWHYIQETIVKQEK